MSPSDLLGVAEGLRHPQPPRQVGRTTLLGLTASPPRGLGSRAPPRSRGDRPGALAPLLRDLLRLRCRSAPPLPGRRADALRRQRLPPGARTGRGADPPPELPP